MSCQSESFLTEIKGFRRARNNTNNQINVVNGNKAQSMEKQSTEADNELLLSELFAEHGKCCMSHPVNTVYTGTAEEHRARLELS